MENSLLPLELYPSGYLPLIKPTFDFSSTHLQFLAINSCLPPPAAASAGYPLPKGMFPAGNHTLGSITLYLVIPDSRHSLTSLLQP